MRKKFFSVRKNNFPVRKNNFLVRKSLPHAFQPLKGQKGNYGCWVVMLASWLDCDVQAAPSMCMFHACSMHLPGRHPTKPGVFQPNQETQRGFVAFGNLAILSRRARNFRPMALRPRLSPGLPLSVPYRAMLARNFTTAPYNQFSGWFRKATRRAMDSFGGVRLQVKRITVGDKADQRAG